MAQHPAARAAACTKWKPHSGKTERNKFCWNVIKWRFNQWLPNFAFNLFIFFFLNQMDKLLFLLFIYAFLLLNGETKHSFDNQCNEPGDEIMKRTTRWLNNNNHHFIGAHQCQSLRLKISRWVDAAAARLQQRHLQKHWPKWRNDSYLLVALGRHLREKRGEESGVLQQNPAHDPQVGGHNHWISLYTQTRTRTRTVNIPSQTLSKS